MRPSIVHKVFATLIVATAAVVVSMYFFVQWSFERGFVQFVEARELERRETLAASLGSLYEGTQSWSAVLADPWRLRQLSAPPRRPGSPDSGRLPSGSHRRPGDHSGLGPGLVLLDSDRELILGRAREPSRLELTPIVSSGAVVGYLGSEPRPPLAEMTDLRFVEQQTQSFVIVAAGILVVSLLMGLPLARALVAPLRQVTEGARSLAAGDYATRLPVRSSDELGQLAHDFNDLAAALERTEQARRQWAADVSHELRTPLAVLRGEIEALQDGVRPFDGEVLGSLHTEVMHLGALVDQLYQLTLHDAGAAVYHKSAMAPLDELREDLEALRAGFVAKHIEVTVDLDGAGNPHIQGDAGKLSQLFRNLLTNSMKHTAPGGKLMIGARTDDDELVISIEDSAPGVSDEALQHLFDRFYRVDDSRSRETGGAGLGLAISRSIVEAHGGNVSAAHSRLGGLAVEVRLPLGQ